MSINLSGLNSKVKSQHVSIFVPPEHPLVLLANSLDWLAIGNLVMEDLRNTTKKGLWRLGRPLFLRCHLSIYFLQIIFDFTDRGIIHHLKYNAAYQLFCGYGIIEKWLVHPTKVEEFRNRLTPETQRNLANHIATLAFKYGFAEPSKIDVDSTPQQANVSYPSDANLLVKLTGKAKKVLEWRSLKGKKVPEIAYGAVKSAAKSYFFQSKNTAKEIKQQYFTKIHTIAKAEIYAALESMDGLSKNLIDQMPWNIRNDYTQISSKAKRYLLDVAHFIREHSMKKGKILAFHLNSIACITKGKAGKEREFGREFQIARLAGNFVIASKMDALRANDKNSLAAMVETHQSLFGEATIESLTADRGYESEANHQACSAIPDYHLGYHYEDQTEEDFHRLYSRRAGVEPVIGHIKKGGQLGISRMKSDQSTFAAGYAAMAGFNLRQMMRSLD